MRNKIRDPYNINYTYWITQNVKGIRKSLESFIRLRMSVLQRKKAEIMKNYRTAQNKQCLDSG